MIKPPFPACVRPETKPHLFCPGCGHPIALKVLAEVIDQLKIAPKTLIGLDIGCALLAWDFFAVDTLQTHHGRTVSIISGFKIASPKTIGIAYVGDGGGYAIGLQSLLHAAHRNDPITVIVINNTLYAMTGGQESPTTLCGQKTDSTPQGRDCKFGEPFLGPETVSIISQSSAYLARGSISDPIGLKIFLRRAIENQIKRNSFSLVEILSTCPVNWKTTIPETWKFLNEKMNKYFKVGEISCRVSCK